MIPLVIDGWTARLAAPVGSPDVRPLHVREVDGCLVSRWEPTPEELTILCEGGAIELRVRGSGQPPVSLRAVPSP